MKRFLIGLAITLSAAAVAYVLGPTTSFPVKLTDRISVSGNLTELERDINQSEQRAGLKTDNQARIVWADSLRKQKTPFSIVYIPGFAASWAEGDPVHKRLAKQFGCNLYLARPHEHGVQSRDAMKTLTPASYAASAERALAIGKQLGEKVIVIGTSAGGMLTLYLASRHPELHSIVLYSPCIAVANPALALVTKPWGKQIIDRVMGGEHIEITHYKPDRAQYWLTRYHTNGLITLQTMLDEYMTPENFANVKQPVFLGYYYRDDDHQDKVVSVAAMQEMFQALGTPENQKREVAFPKSGEHVIASHFTSGDLDGVYRETERFLKEVAGLTPVAQPASPLAFDQKK